MAIPVLTPEEQALLEKEFIKQKSIRDGLIESKAAKIQKIAEAQEIDDIFNKFYEYYADTVVTNYDNEWQNLTGRYFPSYFQQVDPPGSPILIPNGNITEYDLEQAAIANGYGRLTPTMPDTAIIRIAEFDGGNTGITEDNESDNSLKVLEILDILQNGINGSVNSATTTSTITPTSTQVNISQAPTVTISAGDEFVVQSGGNVSIIRVTAVNNVITVGPLQTATLVFDFILVPAGNIGSGQTLDTFGGFSNSNRNTKTAGNQALMDALVDFLDSTVNSWSSNVNAQITALTGNDDTQQVTEIANALVNANSAKTFIDNYSLTLDITDTGITSVQSFTSLRNPQITVRVSEIQNAYTGGAINYYDERYKYANIRANTANGSLRIVKTSEATIDTLDAMIADAQAAMDAIADILP